MEILALLSLLMREQLLSGSEPPCSSRVLGLEGKENP